MKKLLVLATLLAAASVARAADSLIDRPDVYGPAATQYSFANIPCVNTSIKTTSGVLGCVMVTSAPANIWSIRDATSATGAVVVSTFPASIGVGTYCPSQDGTKLDNGLQIVIPASGACQMTVTYR